MSLQDRCFNPTSFTMAQHPSIRSRKHAPGVHPLLGTSLVALSALATASAAHAQATATQEEGKTLEAVSVKASRVNSFKVEESASNKFTQPLVDTPKTVQVIGQQVLKEQGAASLMDALRNTPGITMQLGENGNTSAGDAFSMRGFSTQTSTFVDGIRDMGAIARDTFNIEQVEVVKGPAGANIGRGAASGYINLISKLPKREDASEANLTLGTADKKRITADINRAFGDSGAFRINAMVQDSGVDGRDWVKNQGAAVAPSIAFGLGTPTRLNLYSLHVRHKNRPDGGIPGIGYEGFYSSAALSTLGSNVAKVDRSNFYGSRNDFERVDSDMFTAKLEHDLGQKTTVRNLTRYGKTAMDRVMTAVNAITTTNLSNPASWTGTRTRQRTDQVNEILVNQTSVNTTFDIAGMENDLAAGVEFMYERQYSKGFASTAQTIRGVSYAAITNPAANLYNPNALDVLGIPYATGVNTDGKTVTASVYALDTLTISPQWKVNAGLRLDRYSSSTTSGVIVTSTGNNPNIGTYGPMGYTAGSVVPVDLSDSGNLVSWDVGAVYKPAENGSVYVSMANSLTPPGSANFSLSSSATNQSSPTMDPQTTKTVELGTKWDLLNKRLNVAAAIFRTENDKQTSQDTTTGATYQFGKTRVEGIELNAVGQVTNFWQVIAGVAKLKTRQLDQYSRSATTGAVTTTEAVRWTPDLSANLWTSYTLDQWTFGAGGRYYSKQKRLITNANPATESIPDIPGYAVADAMVAYKVSKNVNLQLNVSNLFDKKYIGAPNNGGARLAIGAPRSAALTASVKF